ncbi:sulfurtransferase TusA family protein [Methylotenera sp.]|uniref:sulfurtransferase TusA family protein n=1 Tax=Methylotenera sp. TaxID=2051956 RepID=UPI00248A76E8|nr:sulfurtransferase TusA family protein [Methylotenera sp.]MDI1298552.1 sulfurtransferase TusA family protein [Methylotenera sp.]
MTNNYDIILDATEFDCPMPTIHTKNALDGMTAGQTLKLLTSKEGTIKNIRTFVANNPYTLLSESKEKEGFVFIIQKL